MDIRTVESLRYRCASLVIYTLPKGFNGRIEIDGYEKHIGMHNESKIALVSNMKAVVDEYLGTSSL